MPQPRSRAGDGDGAREPEAVNRRPELRLPRARKRFGQHFLVDRASARRIVDLVAPLPGDVVVEIGPGRGALTELLLSALARLIAVEIDRDLAAALRSRFAECKLRLIEGDILQIDLGDLLREEGGKRLLVVGNLPYNITAPLLFGFLDQADCIRKAILMVQREVARRLVAQPGSREYSLLTVLLTMRAEVEVRLDVDRRAFRPVPGVDSSVIELRFADSCRHQVVDERVFSRVVRTAFGQRRKMLRNSLLGLVPDGGRERLEEIAGAVEIDLRRRPETLSVEEFARLSDAFTG